MLSKTQSSTLTQMLLPLFCFCSFLSKERQAKGTIDIFLHQPHLRDCFRSSRFWGRNIVYNEDVLICVRYSRDRYTLRRSLPINWGEISRWHTERSPTGLKIDGVLILVRRGAKLDKNKRKTYMGCHFIVSFNHFVYCDLEKQNSDIYGA